MRKSFLFETIYKELLRIGKSKSYFTREDLRRLISIHQKYSVFVYKHSNEKNKYKMTLYFVRGKKLNGLITFRISNKVLNEYLSRFMLK